MGAFDKRFVRITRGTEDARAQKEQKFWGTRAEERKTYEQYAVEPTERQRKIIQIARQGVDQIIRGYGGDPSQSPEYRIFLIPSSAFTELESEFPSSFISHFNQSILIELENPDVGFALSIAHELFHACSPNKIHVDLDHDRTAASDQSDEKKIAYLTGAVNGLREAGIFYTSNRYEERQKLNTPAIRMIERTLGRSAVRRIVKDFSGRIQDHVVQDQEQEKEKEENKEGI